MRQLDIDTAACEPFAGGHRLSVKARSGESFVMELRPDLVAALRPQFAADYVAPATESAPAPIPEPVPDPEPGPVAVLETEKPKRKSAKA